MGTSSQHVQTADLRVHYLQAGAGTPGRDPVVFVHGFPQTSHQWRHQLRALSEAGWACFAPDNRGFGATDKPLIRVNRAMLGDDVVRFCDAVGIERCHLVGHDWGGIIAFKAAVDHPERFVSLAMLDTLCTTWSPLGHHGYWFKAEGLAEEFFARHHRAFIEVLFAGRDAANLGGRPLNPWGRIPAGPRPRPGWVDDEALAHYVAAFSQPESWHHAIQYYRYGLPFHRVFADPSATHGERYELYSESRVAELWLHPGGIEVHPLAGEHFDYGPEDRHKRFGRPVLWLYGSYSGGGRVDQGRTEVPSGTPFYDQFGRYFADLRARSVGAGHFVGEEAAAYVNECLLAFLDGRM